MAVARNTGISKHLIYFCTSHIEVHGKTESSRLYLRECIELWRGHYGDAIADEVKAHVAQAWGEKKSSTKKVLA